MTTCTMSITYKKVDGTRETKTVTVSVDRWDMTLDDMYSEIFDPLLQAHGFSLPNDDV